MYFHGIMVFSNSCSKPLKRIMRYAIHKITKPKSYCGAANTRTYHICMIAAVLNRLIQQLMPLPPFTTRLNLHTLQHPPFQISISYIHTKKSSMRRIKVVGLNGSPYLQYLGRWQRDHVGNGPLEAVARLTWWARMWCVGRLVW